MKPNNVNNQNKRHQSRWVITSATAMILTTLTIANQAASADDTVTTTTNEPTNSQLNANTQVNATQVNLKANTSTSVSTIKSDQPATAAKSPTTSTGSPSEHSSSVNPNQQQQSTNPASQSQATTTSESTPTTDIEHPTQTAPAQTTSASTTEPTTESNTESATDSQAKATTTNDQASKQPSQQTATASSNSTTIGVNTQSTTSSALTDDKIVTSANQEKLALKTNQPVVRATSRTAQENINDWMPNTLLQQEVLSQLRKQNPDRTWNSAADITKADMLLLTTYYGKDTYIDGKTSYSLEGLQYATNLTTVWLNNNLNAPSGSYYSDVTDISPLANLKNLAEVDAAYNHISDFSPLKGFKNLKGTFSNQFITLPPAYISADNNIATLAIDCYLQDGTKVQLKPNGGVGETVFYKNGQLYVRWYFNGAGGGNYDSNGHIYYTNMKPQQPGLTGPTFNGTTVIPMDDYYFMTAASDGNNFVVVRPYVLAATAAPITVKYVDALTGESLVTTDLTLNGIVGQPYTTQRIDDELPNYDFTNIVGNASGVFTADAQTVTYYYTRKDAGDITIHMVDTNGNLVYEPQILPGKHNLGNAYNLDAPTFDHFKLQQTIGNAAGIFTTDPQSITFVYVRLDAGNITVKYQDKQGNQLKPDKTISGSQSLGQAYTTEPLDIENYTLKTTPTNATGTFTDQEQTVIYVYVRRDAGQIVVKYQDSAGNQLAPDKLLDGKEQLGAAYQTTAISIPNFHLVVTPANATGTFSTDTQTVIYQYARSNAGHITVKYQDANGTTLAPDDILTGNGQLGRPYQTNAKTIENYRLIQTPANATGQFSDQAQTVIYVYTRENAGDITVQYLDENGQQLAADSVLSGQGQLGQPYETSPLNINGYTVKSTQGNTTGTYTVQPQRVVYIYERTAGQSVTVKYQDQDGKSIHPDVVHSGYLGDSYSTEQLVIDGYTFKTVQGDVNGTFGTSAKTVTYVYERTAGLPVTVKYLDEHGKSIHPDVVLSGYLGDNYSTEQLAIGGYTFKAVQGDVSGTFGTSAKTVTYVYERTAGLPVTAKYLDEHGKSIHPDVVHSGYLGDGYSTEQLIIDGYTFKAVQGDVSGTFGTSAKTVTYVYTENTPTIPDTQGTVTVHYVTKDGIKLNEPTVLSGKTGTTYQTVPLTFTDHELVGQPENATGLFTADNVDVTYVYQATDTTGTDDIIDPEEPEQPTKPIKPVEPTTPGTPNEPGTTVTQPDRIKPTQPAVAVKPTLKPAAAQVSLVKTTSPVTEHSAQLPQTDEQTGKLAVILGLLLSVVTFGFYGKHRQS
ncbi:MucBP domain-containing protein [Lactiplantibacillus argentoratensis]|uniref:MucBP domain-containing protein n=1 Tax=Lactiplantibacillus argentoratensis TaxID=271881 RepID=UPI001BDCDC2C|nr:MucBP domain-containing protein [Lactiplantibacillus argentoratensis]MBT1142914.1 MucBP domain-containing protein [Lactiplantibacillus argentoratensis]MBT1145774.1 MucBP domain-containing protein [Lactiplantibacillus argentoratensis]MBT1148529.1 MucBP domain-containing protein [Lactiplantibacillus argentoratensis]MBT1153140.1 MucBP domain-containing protein [Lactiplantibacillus argentoratensis]